MLPSIEILNDLLNKILEISSKSEKTRLQEKTIKLIFWIKCNVWKVLKTKWKLVLWYKKWENEETFRINLWENEELVLPIYQNSEIESLSTHAWNLIISIMLDIITLLYLRQDIIDQLKKLQSKRKKSEIKILEEKKEKLTKEILNKHSILTSLISLWIWEKSITITSWENNWKRNNLEIVTLRI